MCREHGSVGAVGPPTPASTEEAGDGRIVGRDLHRDFAEAVALEDGVCRQLGPIESTRDRLEAFADTGQPIDPVAAGCMGNATAVWSILLQKVVRATGPRPGAIHIPRRLDADYSPSSPPSASSPASSTPPHPLLPAQARRRPQRGPRHLRPRPRRPARANQHGPSAERGGRGAVIVVSWFQLWRTLSLQNPFPDQYGCVSRRCGCNCTRWPATRTPSCA